MSQDRLRTSVVALPFVLKRSSDVVGMEITSTRERVDGLLRFDGSELVFQWRVTRSTQRVGMEIRTDREIEPVREVAVPVTALASAALRWVWRRWPPGRYLVLTAADLRAFDDVAGLAGLQLEHPAELALRIGRRDLLTAREFAGELELALADRALRAAEESRQLDADDSVRSSFPTP